jgi:hypothetical protein
MVVEIKSIFAKETLNQIPLFYQFMTEFETLNVGELKVTARFNKCKTHFSEHYLQFGLHKPVSNLDLSNLFKE